MDNGRVFEIKNNNNKTKKKNKKKKQRTNGHVNAHLLSGPTKSTTSFAKFEIVLK